MRRAPVLTIGVVALTVVGLFVYAFTTNAGYCISKFDATKCWNDSELITTTCTGPDGNPCTKRQICEGLSGNYNDDLMSSCAQDASAKVQCCVQQDGTCQIPDASDKCTSAFSFASTHACADLQCVMPTVAPANTKTITFTPNVSLPGSSLFNAGVPIQITGATLGEYIAALYAFIVGAVGILATVMVFYGGLKWLTAAGNRGQVQDAKETISSALIGVVLAFSAYLLLLTISPKLVRFSSLQLQPIQGIQQTFGTAGEVAPGSKGAAAGTISIDGLDQNWYTSMQNQFGTYVNQASQNTGVPTSLIYATMFVESSGNPDATSGKGACGLMQLLETSARNLIPGNPNPSCAELQQPQVGILAGAYYLENLIHDPCPTNVTLTVTDANGNKKTMNRSCNPNATKCGSTSPLSDPTYVIAGYNAGQGANCDSQACSGQTLWECPLNEKPGGGYTETRSYVQKVQAALTKIGSFH